MGVRFHFAVLEFASVYVLRVGGGCMLLSRWAMVAYLPNQVYRNNIVSSYPTPQTHL